MGCTTSKNGNDIKITNSNSKYGSSSNTSNTSTPSKNQSKNDPKDITSSPEYKAGELRLAQAKQSDLAETEIWSRANIHLQDEEFHPHFKFEDSSCFRDNLTKMIKEGRATDAFFRMEKGEDKNLHSVRTEIQIFSPTELDSEHTETKNIDVSSLREWYDANLSLHHPTLAESGSVLVIDDTKVFTKEDVILDCDVINHANKLFRDWYDESVHKPEIAESGSVLVLEVTKIFDKDDVVPDDEVINHADKQYRDWYDESVHKPEMAESGTVLVLDDKEENKDAIKNDKATEQQLKVAKLREERPVSPSGIEKRKKKLDEHFNFKSAGAKTAYRYEIREVVPAVSLEEHLRISAENKTKEQAIIDEIAAKAEKDHIVSFGGCLDDVDSNTDGFDRFRANSNFNELNEKFVIKYHSPDKKKLKGIPVNSKVRAAYGSGVVTKFRLRDDVYEIKLDGFCATLYTKMENLEYVVLAEAESLDLPEPPSFVPVKEPVQEAVPVPVLEAVAA